MFLFDMIIIYYSNYLIVYLITVISSHFPNYIVGVLKVFCDEKRSFNDVSDDDVVTIDWSSCSGSPPLSSVASLDRMPAPASGFIYLSICLSILFIYLLIN